MSHTNASMYVYTQAYMCTRFHKHFEGCGWTRRQCTPGTSISALHNCHVLVVRQLYFLFADTKFIVLRCITNDLA